MNTQAAHLVPAAVAVACYVALCGATWRRAREKHRAASRLAMLPGEQASLLVIHASQTGTAEGIAAQTASALQIAGVDVTLCSLAQLRMETLRNHTEALFVVSTYGEGDAPDAAAHFLATAMRESALDLSNLRYGMLALGDHNYRNFCGFGRSFDAWLQEQGAQPLFARIEADNGDPQALQAWRRELGHIAASTDLPEWQDVPFKPWTLRAREHLNPGSLGAAVFHIELVRADASMDDWHAGDLLQVLVPGEPDRPRDYSIASIPADGAVHLLVRQQIRDDGSMGGASAWLTRDATVGATISARLRVHNQFHIDGNEGRDLVLLGNGTGLAGLRAHLRQRVLEQTTGAPARRHWLLYGERQAAHDALYGAELENWRTSGLLTHLDLVYSRDGGVHRYVQDGLRSEGDRLRQWVEAGAAIYVCGSLEGMAEGVAAALREQLGESILAQLQRDGRYRRDVY